jgi:hypothetical protein
MFVIKYLQVCTCILLLVYAKMAMLLSLTLDTWRLVFSCKELRKKDEEMNNK